MGALHIEQSKSVEFMPPAEKKTCLALAQPPNEAPRTRSHMKHMESEASIPTSTAEPPVWLKPVAKPIDM